MMNQQFLKSGTRDNLEPTRDVVWDIAPRPYTQRLGMASDWTERFGNKLLPSSEESHALVVPSTEEQRRSKQSHSRVETGKRTCR